jgi:hypothetical protein
MKHTQNYGLGKKLLKGNHLYGQELDGKIQKCILIKWVFVMGDGWN